MSFGRLLDYTGEPGFMKTRRCALGPPAMENVHNPAEGHYRSLYNSTLLTTSKRAKCSPKTFALLTNRVPLTYSQLVDQVASVITRLKELGIGRNDRVAIVLANGPEMAMAFLSIASAATSAPLNPAYRASEFDFYLSDLNARALVVLAGDDSPATDVARARDIPVIELVPSADGRAGSSRWRETLGCPRLRSAPPSPTTWLWCCTPQGRPLAPRWCRSRTAICALLQRASGGRCS